MQLDQKSNTLCTHILGLLPIQRYFKGFNSPRAMGQGYVDLKVYIHLCFMSMCLRYQHFNHV